MLAIISSAAFAGCNLFIGLSIGSIWMALPPLDFASRFWEQFTRFTYTIMPLFILTLVGLGLSARLDWAYPRLRPYWVRALLFYVATTAITLVYHVPENLMLRMKNYSASEADSVRFYWLVIHIPRVVLTFGIPVYALAAVFTRDGKEIPEN
ncbi:MAG: hypothetical protein AAGJ34_11090 [Pseudomonadota bacterium]